MNKQMDRKAFLQKLGLLGIVGLGTTSILSSCGESKDTEVKAPPAKKVTDPCSDYTGLTDIDIKTRENLKYVAKSEDAAKVCTKCNFWLAPKEGDPCGGCQLIKGPIKPEGSCISFAPKMTQS